MPKEGKMLKGFERVLVVLSMAVIMAAGATAAHAFGGGYGMQRGQMKEKIAALNLTDEQKAQIKTIAEKYRPTVGPLAKEFAAERKTLEGMIHSDKVDDDAIRAQAAKVASVGADLAVASAHGFSELRAVLTPEQVQKISGGKGNRRVDMLLFRLAKGLGKG